MKIFILVVGILETIMGAIFLLNIASDIQVGFGAVLFAMGIKDIVANLQK